MNQAPVQSVKASQEPMRGMRIPPSPPPIFGSEKALQNQALLEPPGFGGGAPRWSTAAALLWHFPARFATRKFASLTSGDIAELLSCESSPSGHGRIRQLQNSQNLVAGKPKGLLFDLETVASFESEPRFGRHLPREVFLAGVAE
jgi:hypothetical protein